MRLTLSKGVPEQRTPTYDSSDDLTLSYSTPVLKDCMAFLFSSFLVLLV